MRLTAIILTAICVIAALAPTASATTISDGTPVDGVPYVPGAGPYIDYIEKAPSYMTPNGYDYWREDIGKYMAGAYFQNYEVTDGVIWRYMTVTATMTVCHIEGTEVVKETWALGPVYQEGGPQYTAGYGYLAVWLPYGYWIEDYTITWERDGYLSMSTSFDSIFMQIWYLRAFVKPDTYSSFSINKHHPQVWTEGFLHDWELFKIALDYGENMDERQRGALYGWARMLYDNCEWMRSVVLESEANLPDVNYLVNAQYCLDEAEKALDRAEDALYALMIRALIEKLDENQARSLGEAAWQNYMAAAWYGEAAARYIFGDTGSLTADLTADFCLRQAEYLLPMAESSYENVEDLLDPNRESYTEYLCPLIGISAFLVSFYTGSGLKPKRNKGIWMMMLLIISSTIGIIAYIVSRAVI